MKAKLIIIVLLLGIFSLLQAEEPQWWSEKNVLSSNTADDYAAINLGQLRNIAMKAYEKMADLGAANEELQAFVNSPAFTSGENFAAVNIGQVKALSKPFYDRLRAIGQDLEYPWTATTGDEDDYALANIGQVKYVFSFEIDKTLLPTIHYVDLNNTTPQSPYNTWEKAANTIQEAIDVAINGNTVVVTNGLYLTGGKGGYLASIDKAITVKSVNGAENTILDANYENGCVYVGANASLSGFTLRKGYGNVEYGGGAHCEQSAIIENCIIEYCMSGYFGGGVFGGILKNCIIRSNSAGLGGGGANFSTLINCLIERNYTYGVTLGAGGVSDSTLINCTVVKNSSGCSESDIYNSIIWNNGEYDLKDTDGNNTVSHSCAGELTVGVSGNINADPQFIDAENGIYRLKPESPCIDKGKNEHVESEHDLDGIARIINATVDMGTYEYLDADGDSLPDWWETLYDTGPTISNTVWDLDNDGLTLTQEYELGTLPNNPDTDGDLMPDGWEVAYGFNPLDPSDQLEDFDGDGVANVTEYFNGTHPKQPLTITKDITLTGTFNSWNAASHPFTLTEDYVWEIYTDLPVGENRLKFVGWADWSKGTNWGVAAGTAVFPLPVENETAVASSNNNADIKINVTTAGLHHITFDETNLLFSIETVTIIPTNFGPQNPVYHLAGTFNGWDLGRADTIMQKQSNGNYRAVVYLSTNAAQQFKFVENDTYLTSWGETDQVSDIPELNGTAEYGTSAGNINITPTQAGKYQFLFEPVSGNYTVTLQAKDSDEDGIPDDEEDKGGTDPTNSDQDNDGLLDGEEAQYGTDPTNPDHDGDGLQDGAEVHTHGSDPTKRDTDGDGIEDAPEVNTYGTNPSKQDTDEDGLDDPTEIAGPTDPTNPDTDGDGIPDGKDPDPMKPDCYSEEIITMALPSTGRSVSEGVGGPIIKARLSFDPSLPAGAIIKNIRVTGSVDDAAKIGSHKLSWDRTPGSFDKVITSAAATNGVFSIEVYDWAYQHSNNLIAFSGEAEITYVITNEPVRVTGGRNVCIGETLNLSASGGTEDFVWSSSDDNIATVSQSGFVQTHSSGTVRIKASDSYQGDGRCSGYATIKVGEFVFKGDDVICWTDGGKYDAAANIDECASPSLTWNLNSDASAAIDANGMITFGSQPEVVEVIASSGSDNRSFVLYIIDVKVASASICNDSISVSLKPNGIYGKMQLQLIGTAYPDGYEIVSEIKPSGTHDESFNTQSLPEGLFSSIKAIWIVGGKQCSHSMQYAFRNLGVYRHSQYNTPNEAHSTCNGNSVSVCLTDSSCSYSSGYISNLFKSQTDLNGSGITKNYGAIQLEDYCQSNGFPPPVECQDKDIYRSNTTIEPSCGGDLNMNTVAIAPDHEFLSCGDKICLIDVNDGRGITKTVTDSCRACRGYKQIDNYTIDGRCTGIPDLGHFITVELISD